MTPAKWYAFLLLVILQGLDALSTRLALAHGAVEMNPLADGNLLGVKFLALLLCIVLVVVTRRVWHLWVLVGIYAAIVSSNILLAVTR
jgi:hypothetical protein